MVREPREGPAHKPPHPDHPKLPIHPTVKQEAYRYLTHVEQGKPLSEIPEEEKRAFKRVIEQIKQAIWLNTERFAPVLDQLAYAAGLNQGDAARP